MNQYHYYRIIYNTLIQSVTLPAGTMDSPTMDSPRSSALSGGRSHYHGPYAWNIHTTNRISVEKRLLPAAKTRAFLYCSDSPETEPAHEPLRDCP